MALLTAGEPHEAHIYDGHTYGSLSAALEAGAVNTINVEEMTGNLHNSLHNSGSLLTCLRFGEAMASVLDSQTHLVVVVTDCDGLIVDIRS